MLITPVLPTFYIRSANSPPIYSSPLADIVAMLLICSFPLTGIDMFLNYFTIFSTAKSIPFLSSFKLTPISTFLRAYLNIALAKTAAVVVPSPASSLALLDTDFIKFAPILANLSDSYIALATVTPSFVILTGPNP